MQIAPRLVFAGILILALAIVGTAFTPATVSADGGLGDPPIGGPKDSIPEIYDSATAGDSQVDLAVDAFDTGALLYGTWTLFSVI
jgi:hypothetical protein